MYHITENNVVSQCNNTYNCSAGTLPHYDSRELALKDTENIKQYNDFIKREPLLSSFSTTQALNSSLRYNGVIPEWFKGLEKTTQEIFNESPILMDVIETNIGSLAVVWEEHSTSDLNVSLQFESGLQIPCVRYVNVLTGETEAFIQSIYMDNESIRKCWGDNEWTSVCFAQKTLNVDLGMFEVKSCTESHGYICSPFNNDSLNDDVSVKQKIWEKCNETFNLNLGDAPNNNEKLNDGMKMIQEFADEKLELYCESFKYPKVSYVFLNQALHGQGLSESLYVYMARKLSEKNLPLLASENQNYNIDDTWEKIIRNKDITVQLFKVPQASFTVNSVIHLPGIDFNFKETEYI